MDESTKRRTKRERAVELLYQLELTGKSLDEVFSYADPPVLEDERALIVGVWEKRHEIDEMISRTSREWKLDRIGYVERNILRLALYEINYDDVAVPYAINAAVELAKEYSGEEAGRFVNGVLGRAVREKSE
ncbi:MAG: transcription antitermination factor NusB [Bacillota bacterium]|jgi:N utilization substance protein B|nr:transcription antitermination factor NusB [Bacillota bacterium]NLU55137.1 transcription antitermination factor NusB [Bacillota bacterium]HOA90807.1 transcription antitermination factor NusB [Bacillota bacterium]HOJ45737.1 transcription antitermination factor NusB [Bacillota bacterium]HOP54969.1 transcription antitermination factor NusB [Bacillota bacterium]